jgi:ABC-2 type transport system ATP-binding protein
VIEVDHLSKAYGDNLLIDDLSFALPPGGIVGVIGPNGAGKTTLFSLVTRLYDNRSGSIRVFGKELRDFPSRALSQIGVVFQQRTLDLDLSVVQNLKYHAALHGMARGLARARIAEELERLELGERAGDKVRQLSGGQLRRVEIARALLHRPRLLLLDEPTVGLDIGSRQGILDHARKLVREQRLGLLWATHLIDEVAPDNRVVVLHEGKVLAAGALDEVVRQAGAADIREAFGTLTGTRPR